MDQLLSLEQTNSIAHVLWVCVAEQSGEATEVPMEIQDILDKFQSVYEEPTTLPRHRDGDHTIPLVAGAQPVNIWPYRYTPEQKR